MILCVSEKAAIIIGAAATTGTTSLPDNSQVSNEGQVMSNYDFADYLLLCFIILMNFCLEYNFIQ